MGSDGSSTKHQKRDTARLAGLVQTAFAAGDFAEVRRLARELQTLAPDTVGAREAQVLASNLRPDRVAIDVGLVALAIYAAGWIVGLP